MTNGAKTIFVASEADASKYLEQGFVFGRNYAPALGRKQSAEEKLSHKKTMIGMHKNKVHINNGTICKFIPAEELDNYLALG